MSRPPEELHDMHPDDFREHVRSFEFWFGAVQGYLEGQTYGHGVDTPEQAPTGSDRDRLITVLCNYCVGETTALEGAGGLIRLAPNRATKIFLATQTVDEGRHLEVLVHRLRELGVERPEEEIRHRASRRLLDFKGALLELIHEGDWLSAIFAQNVILESMEFAVFHTHATRADPRTREVLLGIVKDERRHIGFGENEVGRRLKESPDAKDRLAEVRRRLDPLVLESFRDTMLQVATPPGEREALARSYLDAVTRLGFV